MCGIVGYIGKKPALPILLKGLRRLEYRGYDSAGIAVLGDRDFSRIRAVGKVQNLADALVSQAAPGTVGIAHTRWATHGGVTEANTHPHVSQSGDIAMVHNGIIENYRELKEKLSDFEFTSQTDSEVLVNLIEKHYNQLDTEKDLSKRLRKAVLQALGHVRGTYGIVVMHKENPDCLIVARLGSPIVIGINDGEYYIASDPSPMLAYTKKCVFLEDGEVAQISLDAMQTFTLKDEGVVKCIEEIEWDEAKAEKGGFEHFMLKEIHDQPQVFQDAIRGRYNLKEGTAYLGGLNMTDEQMRSIKRVIFIACGTASYAGMIGKYAFERLTGIPTTVEISSEFRYSDPIVDEHTLVFCISQSGETADTIAALREAKRKGAYVRGIVNVIGSTIARESDGGTYIHAGPELSVASTKAYTNMVAVVILYALQFGRLKRITLATGQRILHALREIPEKMQKILDQSEAIKEIALKYKDYKNFFFLGRGANFPVALEGSLKLKETSYIHSEAYPGGELKHGPLALLDQNFPVFGIMPKDQLYEKMRSSVQEVCAREAPLVLLVTEGDETARELTDDVLYVPDTMELLEPLLTAIPLQLFGYYISTALGRNPDRPRNLAKSVTVE